MEFHIKVVAEKATQAYAETLEATTSIQVYGTPSEAVLQMLSRQAGAGVPLVVKRHHLGGFTRTPSRLTPRHPRIRSPHQFPALGPPIRARKGLRHCRPSAVPRRSRYLMKVSSRTWVMGPLAA